MCMVKIMYSISSAFEKESQGGCGEKKENRVTARVIAQPIECLPCMHTIHV